MPSAKEFIRHSLIRPDTIEQRLYQLDLAGRSLSASTLVVLPTGLGKTIIALLAIASRLEKFGGKVLMLSPTKPLVDQHTAFFKKALTIPPERILSFTGSVSPENRADLWDAASVIVSTPQVIENDILARRIDLTEVSHITFDEAHRAVGNYAYTYIAEKYFETAANPLCLAITASPGSDDEKIEEVCTNLHIAAVAVKTENDRDVKPYIHKKEIQWVHVNLPEPMKVLKGSLDKVLDDRFNKLTELGVNLPYKAKTSKKELITLQKKFQARLRGDPDPSIYSALSILAEIMKVSHAVEITETQGIEALRKYVSRLESEAYSKSGSKASKRLAEDLYMRQFYRQLTECTIEHPKLEIVKQIVGKELQGKPDSRVIVFTNYRDTAEMVTRGLGEIEGISPVKFIGQSTRAKDKGLTQKKQIEIIEKFKAGEYNVLVATSVAEEGLDIPATDLVLFYEPVPSEIRSIQRKGRTGRKHQGKVIVLVTKGTRDEAYYWSCTSKEKRMQNNMKQLQEILPANGNTDICDYTTSGSDQTDLSSFEPDEDNCAPEPEDETIQVIMDHRETRSTVARSLERMGVRLRLETLEVGDYIVSDRTAIERKAAEDLVNSLLDRDLFRQISDLAKTFDKPILIIEGEGLFTTRQLNPNAIYGTLASIALDFNISILYTRDAEDTASLIHIIAKREQTNEKRPVSAHGKKSSLNVSRQQEYIISSIPDIGPGAARNLLEHFGSIEAIVNADTEKLQQVPLIGPKTAAKIRDIIKKEYKAD